MQTIPNVPRYGNNREIKPGDVVTGRIGLGSFPAEPFIAQLISILPDNRRAEVVFLKRSASGPGAAEVSLFERQNRAAQILESAVVSIDGLALRHRASQPMNDTAERLASTYHRPARLSWGLARTFDRTLKAERA